MDTVQKHGERQAAWVEDVESSPKDENPLLHDAKAQKALVRKIDWRLMPLCAFLYLLNYLDRSSKHACFRTADQYTR